MIKNILKWLGVSLLATILVFITCIQFGVIIADDSSLPNFSHLWEEYRHALAIGIINAIVCVGLVNQVIDINRVEMHSVSIGLTVIMILAPAMILMQGGMHPHPIPVLLGVILLIGTTVLGMMSIAHESETVKPANVTPIMFMVYLYICTPALTSTFLLAVLASVSIFLVSQISVAFKRGLLKKVSS